MRRLPAFLILLALVAISGAPAREISDPEILAGADEVIRHARAMLDEDAPVFVEPCCGGAIRLSAAEFRAFRGRRFYVLAPRNRNPLAIDVRTELTTDAFQYKTLQILGENSADLTVYWTQIHSTAMKRDDYFLTLQLGAFQARAEGQLQDASLLHWRQNNEYQLIAFKAPLDPSDPSFSLILEDQLLVNVISVPNPQSLIPSIRPSISLHPANIGVSMSGGARTRYKVSVGAGYGLSTLPFNSPESATQGFLRLQIRFK